MSIELPLIRERTVKDGVAIAALCVSRGMPITKGSFLTLMADKVVQFTVGEVNALFEDNGPTILVKQRFEAALKKRGLGSKLEGMTTRQLIALATTTNALDTRPLRKKLEGIGVDWYEWQAWNDEPKFAAERLRMAEDGVRKAQADVLHSMTQAAMTGDIRAVEYFNKLSGRFNPNEQNAINVRALLSEVVTILQVVLRDHPDLYNTISGQIQRLMIRQMGQGGMVEGSARQVGEVTQ